MAQAGLGVNPFVENVIKGDTKIIFQGHDFTPNEMQEAGACLKGNKTVTEVQLESCNLTTEHLKRFVEAGGLHENNVQKLFLYDNKIEDISPLHDSMPNVQTLILGENKIEGKDEFKSHWKSLGKDESELDF